MIVVLLSLINVKFLDDNDSPALPTVFSGKTATMPHGGLLAPAQSTPHSLGAPYEMATCPIENEQSLQQLQRQISR